LKDTNAARVYARMARDLARYPLSAELRGSVAVHRVIAAIAKAAESGSYPQRMPMHSPPSGRIEQVTRSIACSLRPLTTTLAPEVANWRTVSAPSMGL